jgi:hypothetical protein
MYLEFVLLKFTFTFANITFIELTFVKLSHWSKETCVHVYLYCLICQLCIYALLRIALYVLFMYSWRSSERKRPWCITCWPYLNKDLYTQQPKPSELLCGIGASTVNNFYSHRDVWSPTISRYTSTAVLLLPHTSGYALVMLVTPLSSFDTVRATFVTVDQPCLNTDHRLFACYHSDQLWQPSQQCRNMCLRNSEWHPKFSKLDWKEDLLVQYTSTTSTLPSSSTPRVQPISAETLDLRKP